MDSALLARLRTLAMPYGKYKGRVLAELRGARPMTSPEKAST